MAFKQPPVSSAAPPSIPPRQNQCSSSSHNPPANAPPSDSYDPYYSTFYSAAPPRVPNYSATDSPYHNHRDNVDSPTMDNYSPAPAPHSGFGAAHTSSPYSATPDTAPVHSRHKILNSYSDLNRMSPIPEISYNNSHSSRTTPSHPVLNLHEPYGSSRSLTKSSDTVV